MASAAEGDLKGMAIAGVGGIIPGANALGEVMDPARKAVGSVGDSEKALKKATDGLDSAGDTLKKAPDEAVAKLEKKVEDAVEEGAAVAPNNAFNAAQAGGKHAGFLKNYAGKSASELKSGIASLQKQIAEHADKIANPEKYIPNFKQLDPRQQAALLGNKWPSDIARLQEQADILQGLLKLLGGS
ncbi:MAG: hypothetical protein DWH91_03425 [Planctomycetota bacterium]|nr:MAG: hypothetical protein DWH91_03425 [Planctomycetota bacterium]